MISRRKLIAALGASLLPAVAHAATSTAPPPPEKSKPVAKAPAKPAAAKKPPAKKPAAKKQVAKKKAPPPGYETPSGTYRPFRLEKEHYSKEWDDAPMPYSIFFTGRGHAVHGSYHVKSLGRRASHGCVRLHLDNAAKLFGLVQKTGTSNTRVVVKGGLFADGANPAEKVKNNPFKNWFN